MLTDRTSCCTLNVVSKTDISRCSCGEQDMGRWWNNRKAIKREEKRETGKMWVQMIYLFYYWADDLRVHTFFFWITCTERDIHTLTFCLRPKHTQPDIHLTQRDLHAFQHLLSLSRVSPKIMTLSRTQSHSFSPCCCRALLSLFHNRIRYHFFRSSSRLVT